LSLRQTRLPVHPYHLGSTLQAKWKVNLFLAKWLAFCLSRGHRFPAEPRVPLDSEAKIPALTLP